MKPLPDHLLLRSTAALLRRLPVDAKHWGRIPLLGDPTHQDAEAYQRWSRLGPTPAQARDFPAWFVLNLGYWHQRHFYLTGRYFEHWITDWLKASLGPGDVFIDIGANLGFHTLYASHRVGASGRVIGFEPNPDVFRLLDGHVALNRAANVELRQIALSDGAAPETRVLSVPARPDGRQDGESALGSLGGVSESHMRQVDVSVDSGDRQLDDIPPEARGACKIDVEGWEMQVLRGMGSFVERHPRFSYCVEVTPAWLVEMGGASAEALVEFFRSRGFVAHSMYDDSLVTNLPGGDQYDLVFRRAET